ncbi:MAG TPA: DUF6179 domain-containing protein [Syntrophomonadaceae bacterium]|nr:DUF6179 domain-containing protein [Syntrophomonadaceae bacterium]HQA06933.1 DUF6179 domain-containing protein [Syntrophomonadaceae bacterium]HQE23174.1 DUF6179 domain-containing protein [Syntrophomonadaceae bacterium]
MNNLPFSKHPLKPSALNPDNYLVSLLNTAFASQLISEIDIQTIQAQVMDVFKEVLFRYTGGLSSSVTTATAQSLINSILYCIDARLLALNSPEESLRELQSKPVSEIYKDGLILVESCLEETRQLYALTKASRIATDLIAYNSTIDKGLPGFLAYYDPRFRAHDTMADIDYPLASNCLNQRGIFYIQEYIRMLNLENQFCSRFAESDISRLLQNYGRTYHIDYPEFLLNIFEIVFTNAVFAVMLGQGACHLSISKSDSDFLRSQLYSLDLSLIPTVLKQTVDRLIVQLGISNSELISYIKSAENSLIHRVLQALKNDSLDKILISDFPDRIESATLKQHEIMKDADFRNLVNQLSQPVDSQTKSALILDNIHTLTDFIDILEADCLDSQDYQVLFQHLGDLELSMLASQIMPDICWDEDAPLMQRLSSTHAEKEWEAQLILYLTNMSSEKLKVIQQLIIQLV